MKVKKPIVLLLTALLVALGGTAAAQPILQLYIEGATYDTDSDSWVIAQNNLRLWVIGNVDLHGPILDVKLSVAFQTGQVGTIDLTPSTTMMPEVPDPSTPMDPVPTTGVGGNGTIPLMSDLKPLPTHGIYGAGTSFNQWELGNFDKMDSPIGDFINSFPVDFPKMGQINVYDVAITGFTTVHFDAYNHVEGWNHATKAPFSHDAETAVPEPGTLILVGAGLLGSTVLSRKRKKRS